MKSCTECNQETKWVASLQYQTEYHNFGKEDKERFKKVADRVYKEWK